MSIIQTIFAALFALGLVIFFKFMAIPYALRQYKFWRLRRALRKMAKGKEAEIAEHLNNVAKALSEIARLDKM